MATPKVKRKLIEQEIISPKRNLIKRKVVRLAINVLWDNYWAPFSSVKIRAKTLDIGFGGARRGWNDKTRGWGSKILIF